jgi:hypothetical protein
MCLQAPGRRKTDFFKLILSHGFLVEGDRKQSRRPITAFAHTFRKKISVVRCLNWGRFLKYQVESVGGNAIHRRTMKLTLRVIVVIITHDVKRIVSQPDYSCDFLNDQCGSQFDGVCDSILGTNALPGCGSGDCFDCNLCAQFNADCKGCLEAKGCYYCPGDGTCNNSPIYIFEGGIQSCLEQVDYITDGESCSLTPEQNFFDDPLYDGQRWVYDMINIVPVWERGYFGSGVRVRVNDDGVESTHPGTFAF